MIRKAVLILVILVSSLVVNAQVTYSVQLTWKPSSASTDKVPGAVTVMRAVGACPASGIGTLTYQTISTTAPAAGPFVDTAVNASTTYCYYIKAVVSGVTYGPSNTWQAAVPVAGTPPSALSGTVTQVTITVTTK